MVDQDKINYNYRAFPLEHDMRASLMGGHTCNKMIKAYNTSFLCKGLVIKLIGVSY